MKCWKYNPHERRCSSGWSVCAFVCVCVQGRGKVFYVGGAVGGGGGGVGSQFLHIETENRAIAYALSWDRVRQQLAILQMGIGYNEFITMFYIQVTFKLKNP